MTKIRDLLNQNQDFLKWHEFAMKFNLNVSFTTYRMAWLTQSQKIGKLILQTLFQTSYYTTVNTLRTSSIYSSLLNAVFVPPTAETKILRHGWFILCHLQPQTKLK